MTQKDNKKLSRADVRGHVVQPRQERLLWLRHQRITAASATTGVVQRARQTAGEQSEPQLYSRTDTTSHIKMKGLTILSSFQDATDDVTKLQSSAWTSKWRNRGSHRLDRHRL